MAKGNNQRGNKEAKKPKQEKVKVAPAAPVLGAKAPAGGAAKKPK